MNPAFQKQTSMYPPWQPTERKLPELKTDPNDWTESTENTEFTDSKDHKVLTPSSPKKELMARMLKAAFQERTEKAALRDLYDHHAPALS
mmetsp:Transcript_46148/g.92625  ORF Transcript_46148/g.92625 Transcript_46148/m.92625 type:complete len:90 (+) Transcript_46148:69-338(+)